MRSTLYTLAALVALAGCGIWWAGGAHRGWTKNKVAVEKIDEVTEIAYVEYEDRFVPGVEFPLASLALAFVLGGVALFVRK
jgi:hypothetical protein